MNVLSLFDGMSCGRIALERAGVSVTNYFASEIDKHAIKVAMHNYPDTKQLGDVTKWREWQLPQIDLLIGGSPCQGFSFAGKQLAFDDPRSKLFFEYVDCLKHFKPKYFLLENVRMKKEHLQVITDMLGVEPIRINSNLVSAQNRDRYYWTNIPNVAQPEDKGVLLSHIVHEATDKDFAFGDYQKYVVPVDDTLHILQKEVQCGKVGYFRQDSHANRVYYVHGKAVTLLGSAGGGAAKMGQYLFGCISPDRVEKRQNGRRFNTGEKAYTLTAQDKHGILTGGYIRKLTPIECERLQTVPDNYTSCVSDSQRYKMLGNGWTVDVVAHILSGVAHESVQNGTADGCGYCGRLGDVADFFRKLSTEQEPLGSEFEQVLFDNLWDLYQS